MIVAASMTIYFIKSIDNEKVSTVAALAAQESGLHKSFISDINMNSPKILHDLYLSTTAVQQAVTAQEQIIRKIADQGACIIVGRAAHYVLREYKNVVRIFINAPENIV